MKKLLLSLSLIFTIILGFIVSKISNLMYKYSRMEVFTESNKLASKLCIDIKDNLNVIWIIWGVLIVLLIIQVFYVFKNNENF